MPLTINTNMAASRASYFLSKNNDALQRSLDRLSSGRKITQPADDAGGLAVSMKMQGSIDNLWCCQQCRECPVLPPSTGWHTGRCPGLLEE